MLLTRQRMSERAMAHEIRYRSTSMEPTFHEQTEKRMQSPISSTLRADRLAIARALGRAARALDSSRTPLPPDVALRVAEKFHKKGYFIPEKLDLEIRTTQARDKRVLLVQSEIAQREHTVYNDKARHLCSRRYKKPVKFFVF